MNVKAFSAALLLSFFLSLQGNAQQVHTYVSIDSVQVGDVFDYIIVFNGTYQNVEYPGEDNFGNDLDVLSRQRYQVSASRDSLVYSLQFFGNDDITIPRQNIYLQTSDTDTTLQTNRVPLFFKSTLAEGDEEFRPFKPIFDFARSWWPYILLMILLAAAAYFLYSWYKNRDEATEEPIEDVPPPEFVNPLDQLRTTISELPGVYQLKTRDDFEAYYIELGDAIRRYIKRVYGFPAMEMTTTEINNSLRAELASPKIIAITRKVLNEADMVKFANFQPTTEMAESVLHKANNFIEIVNVVDHEKIEYMKYQHDIEHGKIDGSKIKEKEKVT